MAQQQFKVTLKNPKTGQVFEGSLMGETEAAVRLTAEQRGLEILSIAPVGGAAPAPTPSVQQPSIPPPPPAQPMQPVASQASVPQPPSLPSTPVTKPITAPARPSAPNNPPPSSFAPAPESHSHKKGHGTNSPLWLSRRSPSRPCST